MDGIHDYWRGGAGKHSACSDGLYLVSEGNGKIIQREIPRIFMYGVFCCILYTKMRLQSATFRKYFYGFSYADLCGILKLREYGHENADKE